MKAFLKEVTDEWRTLKYWPSYIYSWAGIKWGLRSFLIAANNELVKIISQLRDRPSTLFVCILSLVLAYFIIFYVDQSATSDLLSSAMNVIVTLLSVLIAAAIFISTLHQRNLNRTIDEDILLKKQMMKSKYIFSEAYDILKDKANDDDKVTLFKAVPAVSVNNDYDYQLFKKWHSKEVRGINRKALEPYDRFILYPYDLVMQMNGMRTYYISEASIIALKLLDKATDNKSRRLRQSIEVLQSAAERYHTAGTHGYYVPVELAGRHLLRIVSYCLLALASIIVALLFHQYNNDIFTRFNFHVTEITLGLAVIFSTLALFLIIRHIFSFIKYMRDSASYTGNMFESFYVYEEDDTAMDPESPYTHG